MTDRSCRGGERPAWPPHRSALPGGQPAVMETCARRQVLRDWQSWPPRPSGAPPDPGEPGPRAAWCSHARTRAAARSACVRPCAAACGGRVASAACSSTRPPAGRPRIRCGGHSQKQAVAVAGDRVVQHRDGATGGVLQHKIANHADADDRQHKETVQPWPPPTKSLARSVQAGPARSERQERDPAYSSVARDPEESAGPCHTEMGGQLWHVASSSTRDREPRGRPPGAVGAGLGGDRRVDQPLPRTPIPRQAGGRHSGRARGIKVEPSDEAQQARRLDQSGRKTGCKRRVEMSSQGLSGVAVAPVVVLLPSSES
jgi:hypothetical protein